MDVHPVGILGSDICRGMSRSGRSTSTGTWRNIDFQSVLASGGHRGRDASNRLFDRQQNGGQQVAESTGVVNVVLLPASSQVRSRDPAFRLIHGLIRML